MPEFPDLPDLPDLGAIAIPDLPDLDAIELEGLPDLDAAPPEDVFAKLEGKYSGNVEHDTALDDAEIVDQFAAVKEGRQKQAESIALANDTEFWFAVYFQTREQKEEFLRSQGWLEWGDKYLDGAFLAKKLGVTLPPRPAPYKVGKIDQRLADLT